MITLYVRQEGGVLATPWTMGEPVPYDVVWVDMEQTSAEDEAALQAAMGIDLPTHEDEWKNDVLNRMYRVDATAYMTAAVINKTTSPYPETRPITFVLNETTLVTMRDIAPTSFKTFAKRLATSSRDLTSGPEIMEGLLVEMVTRVAYNSELVVTELDDLSHQIFDPYGMQETQNTSDAMRSALQRLGTAADLNGKINESLHSLARLLAFFKEDQEDNHYLGRKLDVLALDVRELLQHTAFLGDKITFLLDATLGMINVEQNMIMKILSVFTVIIMPPTLIGSIYGMNFRFMPELSHMWGYPLALLLMLGCAAGPYLYFRKKRWL